MQLYTCVYTDTFGSAHFTVPITHKFIEKRACFFFRRAWLAPTFLIRRALFSWQARLSREGSSLRRARLKYRLACQIRQARLYKPPGALADGFGRAWRSSRARPHLAMSEPGLCAPTVSELMRAFVPLFFFFFLCVTARFHLHPHLQCLTHNFPAVKYILNIRLSLFQTQKVTRLKHAGFSYNQPKKKKRLYAEDETDITYRSLSQIVKYIEKPVCWERYMCNPVEIYPKES